MTSLIEEAGEWEEEGSNKREAASSLGGGKRRRVGVVPSSFSDDYAIDQKVKRACKGLLPGTQRLIMELPSDEDKVILADFINDCYDQENVALKTRRAYLIVLVYLSRHLGHKKHFREMSREDIFSYLNSLKKDNNDNNSGWSNNNKGASTAAYKSWISTYNQRASVISKFFKWSTQPDLKPKERQMPPMLRGLTTHFTNKEKTPVQARDLWSEQDNAIFMKYCEDARLACYHMIAHDTGARPSEILALRVWDIKIKQSSTTGKWYAEVEVGRGGKTKSRIVPLTDSLPYYRAWLAQHPMAQGEENNPEAFIFLSQENSAMYRNLPLREDSIRNIYRKMKKEYLPLVLKRSEVSLDDKVKIRELLKKPFNPYIFRHTTLTRLAPKMSSYHFSLHSGHVKGSKMIEVYTHEFGGESSRELLLTYGILDEKDIINSGKEGSGAQQQHQLLQYKQCPACSIDNKRDAKFCSGCKMVLTYDAYADTKN